MSAIYLIIMALQGEPRALVWAGYHLAEPPSQSSAALYWHLHPGYRHQRSNLLHAGAAQIEINNSEGMPR